ncbi:ABC-type nitrate/sulfonate/bicarbonate transport system, permease component [Amycolatopsis arida]|uniref:ABC-type nitrate/sulfonate/bicarbonate transport system, permease component n=1 Tax=Amycolatopsis arida TaxID=587909 RepID=A0A1I5MFW4_9PSEU|nr:ABC transporter permease [Amycolatopsis arida]TDX94063.1 ABC-type nitrate/sulfonate/bicarbonate transport system permease component [Amycolatopsis arida]SFP07831.1 ABC-type nitrate/sulfonate/bicarbonate transport system, permease component [Amycolatopsis arida]
MKRAPERTLEHSTPGNGADKRRRGGGETVLGWARRLLLVAGLPAVLVAAWWVATAGGGSFYWPPLPTILGVFGETWFESRMVDDVLPSLLRLGVGYALALVVGIAAGAGIGSSRTLRAVVEPVLEFFRAIPPPVLVPVLILFAGIGDGMKVLVIVSGAVWPILLNTVEGVRSIDEVLRDTARCYRFRRRTRLAQLVLRGASPRIVTGARQSLSIAIILMVIGEMFAASNGLGYSIVQFQRGFAIPQMWSGIILLGLIGVALSLAFRIVESRVLSWHRGLREAQRSGR